MQKSTAKISSRNRVYQGLITPDQAPIYCLILVVVFGTQVSWNVSLSSKETAWISSPPRLTFVFGSG